MADPVTTAGIAAGTVATGVTIGAIAAQLGVPAPTLIIAAVGAAIATGHAERLEWSRAGLWIGASSFSVSLMFGVLGGRFCGHVIAQAFSKLGITVPLDAAITLLTLLISLLAQSVILPALSKRIGVEIETRGSQK